MGARTAVYLTALWCVGWMGLSGCTTGTEPSAAPAQPGIAPAQTVMAPAAMTPSSTATTSAAPGEAARASAPAATTPIIPPAGPAAMSAGAAGAAATGGVATVPSVGEAADGYVPCAAQQAVSNACLACHGAKLLGGAPMALMTYADWHKAAVTQPSMKVYELAQMRLHDQARPMPPGGQIQAADRTMLDAWLAGGAVASTAPTDATCATTPAEAGTTGSEDGSFGEIVPAEGETCYEFPVHASTSDPEDTTPYDVGTGEHYEQFYFEVPWPAGTVATRYGAKYDNVKVLHHWLLFSTTETDRAGSHKTAPLPTLAGVDAQLLAGWAVGGSNMAAPEDVGFELPDPGRKLNVQWHFFNSTNERQVDRSIVQVCTVPASLRKNTATLSWLGQEDLNGNVFLGGEGMPPHQESSFTGTCNPRRRGMNDTDPINIVIFWPHMHQLGINMTATINRADGTKDAIFDEPFDFSSQLHFAVDHKLYPGDTLTTTCLFNNTTDRGVPFGESSNTEMCYMFTYAWPANTLENGATSLIGANNTCW